MEKKALKVFTSSLLLRGRSSEEHDLCALHDLRRAYLVFVSQNTLEEKLLFRERDTRDGFQPPLDVQHANSVRHHAAQLVHRLAVADLTYVRCRTKGGMERVEVAAAPAMDEWDAHEYAKERLVYFSTHVVGGTDLQSLRDSEGPSSSNRMQSGARDEHTNKTQSTVNPGSM